MTRRGRRVGFGVETVRDAIVALVPLVAVVLVCDAARVFAAGPPRDMLVVLNKSDNTASIIDIASKNALATPKTGFGPHEAEALPGGRAVVVSNYGTAERPGQSLSILDLQHKWTAFTVDLPPHSRPHGLHALSPDRVLVTAEGVKELLVTDPLHHRLVQRIPLGRETSHMVTATSDGARAFVANIGSGSVSAVDLAEGKEIAEIKTGAGAEGIDMRPGDAEVWVANRDANTISVIDTKKLAVVATIKLGEFPIRLKFYPGGRRALVSCAKSGDVVVLDAEKRKEIHRIPMDREAVPGAKDRLFSTRFGKSPVPVGILIAPDGLRAFVASTNADVVSVIDLAKLTVVDRITAGKEPDGLAGAFRSQR
jgi:YVTN family beta-propeller protein